MRLGPDAYFRKRETVFRTHLWLMILRVTVNTRSFIAHDVAAYLVCARL